MGHRHIPTAWHYDDFLALDAVINLGALTPEKPRRMPRSIRGKDTGRLLALYQCAEERAPLVWFSWNPAWDFSGAPHPGTFVGRPVAERIVGEGSLRIGVPASVATLRWSDFIARNATPGLMRDLVAGVGDPAEWLATDQPVPFSLMRTIEVWYRGAWVHVADVDSDDFTLYLAEPLT